MRPALHLPVAEKAVEEVQFVEEERREYLPRCSVSTVRPVLNVGAVSCHPLAFPYLMKTSRLPNWVLRKSHKSLRGL